MNNKELFYRFYLFFLLPILSPAEAAATLHVHPNRSQFFWYDPITLSCAAPGNSGNWTLKRNVTSHTSQPCSSGWGVPHKSSCIIENAYPTDTGVYWCESERGECSDPVNITVSAQFQVIGPVQPIVAAPGDDVILPCHVQPHLNLVDYTVVWSKPDLRPDPNDRLSRVNYVHLYRNALEVPDMKIPSYWGRTELFTDGLRKGNISLKITNVTLGDEGRYKCFIPKLKGQIRFSIVSLIVDPNSGKTTTTETPLQPETPEINDNGRRSRLIPLVAFCVVLVVLVVGVGGHIIRVSKCKRAELGDVSLI